MEVGGGPGAVVALVGGGGAESTTSHGSSVAVTAPVGGKGKGKEVEKVESAAEPFLLSEGLPPVPAKLVAKIRKGDFVDMADLLRDNIEASRRQADSEQHRCGGEGKKARWEIPDFLSWLQCFGVYASVVADQQPERFKELMAYQTIMIREARRCGGSGWLAYDSMFRQQAANARGTDWAKLNTSLYTVTFMQQHNGRGRTCQHCLETDHDGVDCALAPVKPTTRPARSQEPGLGWTPPAVSWEPRRAWMGPSMGATGGGAVETRRPQWGGVYDGRRTSSGLGKHGARPVRRGDPSASAPKKVCFRWNEGGCGFFGCKFWHICAHCGGDHRQSACPGEDPKRPKAE